MAEPCEEEDIILAETRARPVGRIPVGSVRGDIHDIGNNLAGMMMEHADFEMIDFGISIEVDTYRPNAATAV